MKQIYQMTIEIEACDEREAFEKLDETLQTQLKKKGTVIERFEINRSCPADED